MDILEVKKLTKKFGSFTAVDTISFSLKEGEILGLLGQNGAGKTTTIQMLLGVLEPTFGEIRYFGKTFKSHREEILEQVNFSSTYTNLMWWLTVKENLEVMSYMYNIHNRKERIAWVIQTFRLEEVQHQELTELSAGQLTRLNLAKAFINLPKILLLDEPTASLDPEIAYEVRKFLEKERKEFNVSIIITSHNMNEVEELCDRVMIIEKGQIIADDSPSALSQKITMSHIELLIRNEKEKARKYFEKEAIEITEEGKYVSITYPTQQIAKLLEKMHKAGIVYSEINIEKPTLEDYFLQLFERHTNETI